jgi:hypothetical protein
VVVGEGAAVGGCVGGLECGVAVDSKPAGAQATPKNAAAYATSAPKRTHLLILGFSKVRGKPI